MQHQQKIIEKEKKHLVPRMKFNRNKLQTKSMGRAVIKFRNLWPNTFLTMIHMIVT